MGKGQRMTEGMSWVQVRQERKKLLVCLGRFCTEMSAASVLDVCGCADLADFSAQYDWSAVCVTG